MTRKTKNSAKSKTPRELQTKGRKEIEVVAYRRNAMPVTHSDEEVLPIGRDQGSSSRPGEMGQGSSTQNASGERGRLATSPQVRDPSDNLGMGSPPGNGIEDVDPPFTPDRPIQSILEEFRQETCKQVNNISSKNESSLFDVRLQLYKQHVAGLALSERLDGIETMLRTLVEKSTNERSPCQTSGGDRGTSAPDFPPADVAAMQSSNWRSDPVIHTVHHENGLDTVSRGMSRVQIGDKPNAGGGSPHRHYEQGNQGHATGRPEVIATTQGSQQGTRQRPTTLSYGPVTIPVGRLGITSTPFIPQSRGQAHEDSPTPMFGGELPPHFDRQVVAPPPPLPRPEGCIPHPSEYQRQSRIPRNEGNGEPVRNKSYLKNVELPSYEGRTDKKSAHAYIKELLQYQRLYNYPDEEILDSLIPLTLRGPAKIWYQQELRIKPMESMQEFCNRLKSNYQSNNNQIRWEMEKRMQGPDETLSEFIIKMLEYYEQLDMNLEGPEFIGRIIRCLNPTYSPHFRTASRYDSLYDFKKEAEEFDASVARDKYYRPPEAGAGIDPLLAYFPRYGREEVTNRERRAVSPAANQYTRFSDRQEQFRNYAASINHEGRRVSFDKQHTVHQYDNNTPVSNYSNTRSPPPWPQSHQMQGPPIARESSPQRENYGYTNQSPRTNFDTNIRQGSYGQRERDSRALTRSPTRDRSPSPGPFRSNSPLPRNFTGCYTCGGEHRAADCPQNALNMGNGRSLNADRQEL